LSRRKTSNVKFTSFATLFNLNVQVYIKKLVITCVNLFNWKGKLFANRKKRYFEGKR